MRQLVERQRELNIKVFLLLSEAWAVIYSLHNLTDAKKIEW